MTRSVAAQKKAQRKADVLRALRATGSLGAACKASGVARATLHRWREKDRAFGKAVTAALGDWEAAVAEAAVARALDVGLQGAPHEVLDRDGQPVMLRRHDQRALDRLLDRYAGWGDQAARSTPTKAYELALDGAQIAGTLRDVFAQALEAAARGAARGAGELAKAEPRVIEADNGGAGGYPGAGDQGGVTNISPTPPSSPQE